MKKKLLTALAVMGLCAAQAYAAEQPIRIECEDYSRIDVDGYSVASGIEEMSEGAALTISTTQRSDNMTIKYIINAPKDGVYKMTGVTTKMSEGWSSDYYLKINDDDEYIATSDVTEIGPVDCQKLANSTFQYEYKKVNLNKGENVLTVRLNQSDIVGSGSITTYLDYFEFTLAGAGDFKLSKIADKATQGVFELGDNVILYVKGSGMPAHNTLYTYELTDVDENILKRDTLVFAKNMSEAEIHLGQLEEGWYRIELFEYGTRKSTGLVKRFLVLDSIKASEIKDGPWACDSAATWHFGTDLNVIDRVLNVLSRTGVDWLRSRDGWTASSSTHAVRDLDYKNGLRASAALSANPDFLNDYNGDLFKLYGEMKKWGELYKGRKDGFEFGNEPDAHDGTGDSYAAMVKAAAIGISDGDPEMIKLNGGVAGVPMNNNISLYFENDMLRYLDAYAYHSHSGWSGGGVEGLKDYKCFPNIEFAIAYDKDIPLWLNESGINSRIGEDKIQDEESSRAQAKHFVISSAESISMGNDKRFFFLWSPYLENGGNFGCWDQNYDPNPVIGTMAVTARELKDAHYRGPVANLPEGVTGHMINNGERDVAVVWTDGCADVTFTADVTAVDYVGKTVEVRKDANGNSVIKVDRPIFVRYSGEAPESDFYPAYERNTRELKAKTFDVNERIVISSEWENQNPKKVGITGYNVSQNGTKAKVTVYNFNDIKVEGTIDIKIDEEYAADKNELAFSIEPMSTQVFEVTVTATPKAIQREKKRIMFCGSMSDGRELSPLVAYITNYNSGAVAKEYVPVTNLDDESRWNYKNLGGGYVIRTDLGNGEMMFDYHCPATAGWAYPQFYIDEQTRDNMKNSAGLTYKIKLAEKLEEGAWCIQNLYVYLKDGSSYFFEGGMPNFIDFKYFSTDEWMQITVPWNEMGLWAGSSAAVFDAANIESISVGLNLFTDKIPDFYVKDIGIFYEDVPAGAVPMQVSVSGIEDKGRYQSGEDVKFSVNLKGEGFENVRVLLQEELIYDEPYSSDKIDINLGKLERGYYRLEVIGDGKFNVKKLSTVFFYVE